MDYEIIIGLEVHTQLKTETKLFCGCPAVFGARENLQVCPVCLGLPGVLPVLNRKAFEYALKIALALDCQIATRTKFDRKNYFYPDLPKNYQISQYDIPVAKDGWLEIKDKRIGITRVHLEEDAGKLIHPDERTKELNNGRTSPSVSSSFSSSVSLVDLNRTGVPLVEIVSEPEISSPDEAYQYLTELKSLLIYLGVSDCDMEKGSLRCDANISVRPRGEKALKRKTEIKNLNSFKFVAKALEFEAERQINRLKDGLEIGGETRLWDEDRNETRTLRSKEDVEDYRYFPEPDLQDFTITPQSLEEIRKSLPELPSARKKRFISEYQLSPYFANILIQDKPLADYFEQCLKIYNSPKSVCNWLTSEVLRYLNENKIEIASLTITPTRLAGLVKLFDEGRISSTIAKDVFMEMFADTSASAEEIVQQKGLFQISDDSLLETLVKSAIENNPRMVADYRAGKKAALEALLGQVMRLSKGKAHPDKARQLLQKYLQPH
ncbi:MAG: Asp-tRNA(Asn)/Glu-tRNA(Gln) amidotransferase subunit GatB [Planctomycetota bacterium]|nr:Asp-tRNA(Asn)/Glu-tRNA(Gln) amidotransferase subunit GatB [Planctomycetota bacterium]MDI6787282.1 Asp-tRNA(Asn)/Glu-tRNA(Gln) amidotransferase subunit GatB [Planctomycetota bacterium]